MSPKKPGTPKPIKVGLIGEDPHDTVAVMHLLNRRFPDRLELVTLGRGFKGDQLGTIKHKKMMRIAFADQKPRLVVVIRDLDGPLSDTEKLRKREVFFEEINECCNNRALSLLHVEEIEALLLCDLKPFNKRYNTEVTYKRNPMFQAKPKEWAIGKSNHKYVERDCIDLFQKIDLKALEENCKYYGEFIEEFKGRLGLRG